MVFEKTGKTVVTVKSLPVDEKGFAVCTIDNTIMEQNRVAETLYASLMETE